MICFVLFRNVRLRFLCLLYSAINGSHVDLMVTVSHTAEELYAIIAETKTNFSLGDNMDVVVTDNAASFKRATKLLVEGGLAEESSTCCCHTLQLSVKNSLEVRIRAYYIWPLCWLAVYCSSLRSSLWLQIPCVKSILSDFRTMSNKINNNALLLNALRQKQNQPDLQLWFEQEQPVVKEPVHAEPRMLSKKLIQDVITRWNSTFMMLKRILELKDAVIFACHSGDLQDLLVDDVAWLAADVLYKLLTPFKVPYVCDCRWSCIEY